MIVKNILAAKQGDVVTIEPTADLAAAAKLLTERQIGAVVILGADHHVQIESITFSWCAFDQALRFVTEALAGRMDANDFARPVALRLETPEQHKRCPLCA